MPKLKHYGILTAGEDSQAEYAGKYLIATELCCPFCETPITETKEDRRGVNTPFCGICGILVSLVWNIQTNPSSDIRTSLEVRFSPRPESNSADLIIPGELQQEVADDPSAVSGAPAIQPSTDRHEATPLPNQATHSDVASKVLSLFEFKPTVTTGEMLASIECSREGLNKALRKLLDSGELGKVKRGVYQRIRDTNDVNS